jgi:UPF0755 protein
MRISKKKMFLIGCAGLAVLVYFVSAYVYYTKSPIGMDKDIMLEVKKNDSAGKIISALIQKNIIGNKMYFRAMVKFKGHDRNIINGFYLIKKDDSPESFWERILSGEVESYKMTIPEGYNIYQIAQVIEAQQLGKGARFLKLVRDKNFIKALGLKVPTLEGYLFPAKYYFDPVVSEESIVEEMVKKTFSVLHNELGLPEDKSKIEIHKILTIASLIEKEARVKDEMPLISSVFHNRIRQGMRLQCDPTVIYGLKKFEGSLTKNDLVTPSPYNTYTKYGLPPTPIANPSKDAIMSALNPAKSDYTYFVSKNDGTHFFSSSLKEHNKAVYLYQKRKKRGNI